MKEDICHINHIRKDQKSYEPNVSWTPGPGELTHERRRIEKGESLA
jgi:hypothetical protein